MVRRAEYVMKILETERLLLRTWQDSDLDPMAVIDQDPQVCQYLPGIGNREATAAGIERIKKHYKKHGFSVYAVELKSTQEMIGFIGLSVPSFEAHFMPTVEIAWRLASRHWNKGYATEGAMAVLNYAFLQLNLNEIVSFCVVKNQASRRIMEKIGLHRNPADDFAHPKLPEESPLRAHVLYRLSKAEYLKNRER